MGHLGNELEDGPQEPEDLTKFVRPGDQVLFDEILELLRKQKGPEDLD